MLFCIFLHPNIQAQKYPFRNFSATEGLNSNQALSIFQNDDRLLWVGTMEGINFFDGIKFTSPDFLSEIRKKVIYDITKIDGEIFIGTSTGLYIWDNDSLRSVKDKMGNPLPLCLQVVQRFSWYSMDRNRKRIKSIRKRNSEYK